MKQTLLLVVLALGMISVNVGAQTKKVVRKTNTQNKSASKPITKDAREYKVEDDGFEWYKVCKNGKFGAEDKKGNILIPYEYNDILYLTFPYKYIPKNFHAYMGDYVGVYMSNGTCIIPVSRKCTNIWGEGSEDFGTYYTYNKKKEGLCGICDASGIILFEVPYDKIDPVYIKGRFCYEVSKKVNNIEKYGIIDGKGNVVISLQRRKVYVSDDGIYELTEGRNPVKIGNIQSIKTTHNILADNKNGTRPSSHNSQSSNSNSEGGTSKIIVEQHGPVQVWVPCSVCGHNPGVCQTCLGMGTTANGNKCISCNYSGKCHFCNGKGGYYQVQYR